MCKTMIDHHTNEIKCRSTYNLIKKFLPHWLKLNNSIGPAGSAKWGPVNGGSAWASEWALKT